MSPRPRVEEQRRAEILSAAWQAILDKGYAGTRVADIARRSGTSSATVHYYFATKDDVLTEALRFAVRRAFHRHAEELTRVKDPRERLLLLIELQLPSDGVRDEWRIWLEVWNESPRNPAVRTAGHEAYAEWLDFVERILREGQQAGQFAAVDVADFAAHLAGLMDGLGLQVISDSPVIAPERMRSIIVGFLEQELFLEGTDAAAARP